MTTNFSTWGVDSFARPVSGVDGLDSPNQADLANDHSDAIEALETALGAGWSIYAPTPNGNGLTTVTSTWAGLFHRVGYEGDLWLSGEVKGNWAGTGFLSVPLPSGWTAAAIESTGSAWGYPMPNPFGLHWTGTSAVHPSATDLRIIAGLANTDYMPGGGPGYCTATTATGLFDCVAAHGLVAGDRVQVLAADHTAYPSGLTIGNTYFVIASGLTTTAFKVSATSGGGAVTLGSNANVIVTKQVGITYRSVWDAALNGVTSPPGQAFTGDGTTPNDDFIFAQIRVRLA